MQNIIKANEQGRKQERVGRTWGGEGGGGVLTFITRGKGRKGFRVFFFFFFLLSIFFSYDILRVSGDNKRKQEEEGEDSLILH